MTPPPGTVLERYLTNALYERNFFEKDLPTLLAPLEDALPVFERIKALYATQDIHGLNEAQLEDTVIKPALEILGWFPLPQEGKIIQGKLITPDWTLFADKAARDAYMRHGLEERKTLLNGIVALGESKSADKALDTKKADKLHNPYVQLLEYLNYTRLPHGLLSNGREWWLVDNSRISSEKRYLRVDLERIIQEDAAEAFRYFHHFFRKDSFVPVAEELEAPIQALAASEAQARLAVEEDLRRVVYGLDGRDSLFERVGRALFAVTDKTATTAALRDVFENSLYLLFRLLFIAFFEDRYGGQLQAHPSYRYLSLRAVYDGLREAPTPFSGWHNLKQLFTTLAGGNADLGIPLLNGGLFDSGRATLLNRPQVMNNATLKAVLDDLFLYEGGLLRRDFRTLSATHLGAIYEGLLEFEFRVAEEDLFYLEYRIKEKDGWKIRDGYYDTYDAEELRAKKNCQMRDERRIAKGSLYLVGTQNSRKSSGSYYTPSSLSLPLVRRAIDDQLDKTDSVLTLRILDNACGSGHLLIEALNYLTLKALERLGNDAPLAGQLAEEKAKIERTLQPFGMEVDEFAVLKRLLLKRVIYGVDMQPFAVELAHLSLWIDTFVFGTPLSFIEHHVKVGNSLIGTTIARFNAYLSEYKDPLFLYSVKEGFTRLREVFAKLSAIRDTTPEEVQRSNALYKNEILPILGKLDDALNLLNLRDMLLCEGKDQEAGLLSKSGELARKLFEGSDPVLSVKIQEYKTRYRFFNWELEFPEAFAPGNGQGFHIIVGNPPWDKLEFADPDFFSQYRSNYRSMSNSKKTEVRTDLLDKPHIRARYDEGKARVAASNEFYKEHYPFNGGGTDGNLFRFFVERNLGLLLARGTLNYVLPTALLIEDGSANLRRHILERHRVNRFDGFENRAQLFPDVDTRYKFGLLQIERTKDPKQTALMRFMLTDPAVLDTDAGCFEYGLDDLRLTSPSHMAYMEVGGGRPDLDILRRLYGVFKPLDTVWLDFRNELNATLDKKIFLETAQPEGLLPLYKGAMIWQYNSLYAEPEYWLDPKEFDEYLRDTEINRLIRDVYPALPAPSSKNQTKAVLQALGLKDKKNLGRFVKPDRDFYRLGFRDIARDTDERTLIAALVPKDIGAQHTLWLSIPKNYYFHGKNNVAVRETPVERLLFAQALFNSIVLDWILRFSVAIHVTKSYLKRLPMPQPSNTELADHPVYAELVRNSLLLSLHHNPDGFAELKKRFSLTNEEVPRTDKQVDLLRLRNDCLVAGLYQVNSKELAYLIKSFRVMHNERPQYGPALVKMYAEYLAQKSGS